MLIIISSFLVVLITSIVLLSYSSICSKKRVEKKEKKGGKNIEENNREKEVKRKINEKNNLVVSNNTESKKRTVVKNNVRWVKMGFVAGVSDYDHFCNLNGPINDVDGMVKVLRDKNGFKIEDKWISINESDLKNKFDNFCIDRYVCLKKTVNEMFKKGYKSENIRILTIVYFSGHGIFQLEDQFFLPNSFNMSCINNMKNVLLENKENIEDIDDLLEVYQDQFKKNSLSKNHILSQLYKYQKKFVGNDPKKYNIDSKFIIIMDCCREKVKLGNSITIQVKSIGDIKPNHILAYSTQLKKTSNDTTYDENISPYTQCLIDEFGSTNRIEIKALFQNIRTAMERKQYNQIPQYISLLKEPPLLHWPQMDAIAEDGQMIDDVRYENVEEYMKKILVKPRIIRIEGKAAVLNNVRVKIDSYGKIYDTILDFEIIHKSKGSIMLLIYIKNQEKVNEFDSEAVRQWLKYLKIEEKVILDIDIKTFKLFEGYDELFFKMYLKHFKEQLSFVSVGADKNVLESIDQKISPHFITIKNGNSWIRKFTSRNVELKVLDHSICMNDRLLLVLYPKKGIVEKKLIKRWLNFENNERLEVQSLRSYLIDNWQLNRGMSNLTITSNLTIISYGSYQLYNRMFLLKSKHGYVLIDAGGNGNDLRSILKAIKFKDVKYLIITNCLMDHIFGVKQLLQKLPYLKVIVHERDYLNLQNGGQELSGGIFLKILRSRKIPKHFIFQTDYLFRYDNGLDNDIMYDLKDNFNLELIHTPGVTNGGLSVYNSESKELFIGSLVSKKVFRNGISFPYSIINFDNLRDSLKRICSIDAEKIYPSHHNRSITKEDIVKLLMHNNETKIKHYYKKIEKKGGKNIEESREKEVKRKINEKNNLVVSNNTESKKRTVVKNNVRWVKMGFVAGVSDYVDKNFCNLNGPINDVDGMVEVLRDKNGFVIKDEWISINSYKLKVDFENFCIDRYVYLKNNVEELIKNGNSENVRILTIVYFSGHGICQHDDQFLLPRTFEWSYISKYNDLLENKEEMNNINDLIDAHHLKFRSASLSKEHILEELYKSQKKFIKLNPKRYSKIDSKFIVIMDCCRKKVELPPIPITVREKGSDVINHILAYSTQPGKAADDGNELSPYTQCLITELESKESIEITNLFENVRESMEKGFGKTPYYIPLLKKTLLYWPPKDNIETVESFILQQQLTGEDLFEIINEKLKDCKYLKIGNYIISDIVSEELDGITENKWKNRDQSIKGESFLKSIFKKDKLKDNVALLGNPGEGKSSFGKFIVSFLIDNYEKYKLIPIFIDLSKPYSIIENFRLCYKMNDICVLNNHKFIFLLDGYDEIKDKNPRGFNTIFEHENISKVIIISRDNYISNIKGEFTNDQVKEYYKVCPFNDDQIERYLEQFSNEIHQKVKELMEEDETMETLLRTPFYLSLLSNISSTSSLNDKLTKKSDLYKYFVNEWVSQVNIKRKISNLEEFKESFDSLIFSLASNIYMGKKKDINISDANVRKVWKTLSSEEKNFFIIKDFDNHFKFVHISFSEFFVAKGILREFKQLFQKGERVIDGNTGHMIDNSPKSLDDFPLLSHESLEKKDNIISFIIELFDDEIQDVISSGICYDLSKLQFNSIILSNLCLIRFRCDCMLSKDDYRKIILHVNYDFNIIDDIEFSSLVLGYGVFMNYIMETEFNDNISNFIKENYDYSKDVLCGLCLYNCNKMIKNLLEMKNNDIDVNGYADYGWLPLCRAVRNNNLSIVKLLLDQKNIDVNKKEKHGWSPLYYACLKGYIDIVKELLGRKGINVNIQDNDGETPLYISCFKGYFDKVKLLLSRDDIDITIKDKYGRTAMSVAKTEEIRLLLEKKTKELTNKIIQSVNKDIASGDDSLGSIIQ